MVTAELERAWKLRENSEIFKAAQALRMFHGPGEGSGGLEHFAIDRFGDHYWVTEWQVNTGIRSQLVSFLRSKGALSVVGLSRPERGVAPESETWFGIPPAGRFEVREGELRFLIQFVATRHPGLFLDHQPLRQWLVQNVRGLRVLNTFAYTGSLSVAAAKGGAASVTTLDLSKPSIEWAKENAELNGFGDVDLKWISGDVFEWLPRLKKTGARFDCVILDPPSFSHGKKSGKGSAGAGSFSTAKDLERLHTLALDLLDQGGYLVTSINSANISWQKYESDVLRAAVKLKMQLNVVSQIDLPTTFPTRLGQLADRYLKGWILRRV